MNAIEKIISQMNEAAEQERAALEQEERMKIDQNFEQKRTQIETEHQKQKEKQIELLEKKYRQLRNRQQVEVRQENLNAKQEFLRRLFADAIAEMENWDESEQIQFIKKYIVFITFDRQSNIHCWRKNQQLIFLRHCWMNGTMNFPL